MPLLVYASSDDEDFCWRVSGESEGERQSAMDSKTADTKTTAIETHDRALENGEDYRRSSDVLEINEHGNGTTETNSDELRAANSGGEAVDAVVLEQAIEALESKKTKWYAYMTTKEFWAVLLLGYALFYVFMAGY